MRKCEIIELTEKLFFRTHIKERRFYNEARIKVTRKEARKRLDQLNLACELAKTIRHFFPELVSMLRNLPDPRHPSYITYPSAILLMTRILSSLFYISSMRKASEEFNSATAIENIWTLCGESSAGEELPYWETINRYLERVNPSGLQDILCRLCRRLIRSRKFEGAKIRGKYWQVIIDGTQLHSSRGKLDESSLYRIHKKGTKEEYKESYYYVLEAKLVLHPGIVVSIMTEFVENRDKGELEKQDCERKACWRLMKKLKKEFPRLPLCVCVDSLYTCERFFKECVEKGWKYILRFKEGSIPCVSEEYESLKKRETNSWKERVKEGWDKYDYVNGIDYNGNEVNVAEKEEKREKEIKKGKQKGKKRNVYKRFLFLSSLPLSKRNVAGVVEKGRNRWKIENEGFNTQKKQGYYLKHLFSKNYQGIKNHYYLIQIGHMIAQIMETWGRLWEGMHLSMEQKHQKILESFQAVRLKEYSGIKKNIQIRLQ